MITMEADRPDTGMFIRVEWNGERRKKGNGKLGGKVREELLNFKIGFGFAAISRQVPGRRFNIALSVEVDESQTTVFEKYERVHFVVSFSVKR
jgi:hypothetical protein